MVSVTYYSGKGSVQAMMRYSRLKIRGISSNRVTNIGTKVVVGIGCKRHFSLAKGLAYAIKTSS
jgi:hypothetical protein